MLCEVTISNYQFQIINQGFNSLISNCKKSVIARSKATWQSDGVVAKDKVLWQSRDCFPPRFARGRNDCEE